MARVELPPFECSYRGSLLAGVDEVGRGPLIGAVVTAAVILNPDKPIAGLADSKRLTGKKRNILYDEIIENATAWCLGRGEAHEIDRLNIYQATMLAMERAVAGLSVAPEYVLVDGNRCPNWRWRSEPVVKGDARVAAISAASILAKITRDREMEEMELRYPGYGFAKHKGYPTPVHLEALFRLGATSEHRKSFRPVKEAIEQIGFFKETEQEQASELHYPTDLFENSH